MKRATSLMAVVLCFVLAASTGWAYYGRDLERAHRMRDRGDFFEARRQYSAIANDYYTDEYTRRQAGYFVGFCSVRLNEPWNAINDYRRFLQNFDNGNTSLVPDALFVLGRTYETVRDLGNARWCYRECIRRFRYGEFPQKSRERLDYIDGYQGGYGNGGYGNGGYNSGHYRPRFSMEAGPTRDVQAVAETQAPKISGNDPFDGFKMDLQEEKASKLMEKFEQLHSKP